MQPAVDGELLNMQVWKAVTGVQQVSTIKPALVIARSYGERDVLHCCRELTSFSLGSGLGQQKAELPPAGKI
ncbi:hypothetical protein P7K49_020401 [Saguinus oedipus]|uniref:Uncharacterized protein n=1 Tax=Saguinus oedipus TaxID=9490 RepID=A0ABQ9V052_SAGOE|nr:hypothetical protein P7K49_020401 [Saguinus oedipus]